MKKMKMSLANIEGRLSRTEMKNIMAGSGWPGCLDGDECSYYESGTGEVTGTCEANSNNECVCKSMHSSIVTSKCDGIG